MNATHIERIESRVAAIERRLDERPDVQPDKKDAEIRRLRVLIHDAARSYRDRWCIDWTPLFEIMEEVQAEREDANPYG